MSPGGPIEVTQLFKCCYGRFQPCFWPSCCRGPSWWLYFIDLFFFWFWPGWISLFVPVLGIFGLKRWFFIPLRKWVLWDQVFPVTKWRFWLHRTFGTGPCFRVRFFGTSFWPIRGKFGVKSHTDQFRLSWYWFFFRGFNIDLWAWHFRVWVRGVSFSVVISFRVIWSYQIGGAGYFQAQFSNYR